jgi:lysophospholipase L1-like esterase
VTERTILCFGDSNTYGADPTGSSRFARDVRWPGVLAAQLGDGWWVVEEGLGGRTTVHDDPLLPHCNGLEYLVPCLYSHSPLDLVVLFLGLNDLKPRFGLPASDAARGVGMLAEEVLRSKAGPDGGQPLVLILGLPRLGPLDESDDQFEGLAEKAAQLPGLLRQTAEGLGAHFLDLGEVTAFSDADPRHLDARGHGAIGHAVADAARRLVSGRE